MAAHTDRYLAASEPAMARRASRCRWSVVSLDGGRPGACAQAGAAVSVRPLPATSRAAIDADVGGHGVNGRHARAVRLRGAGAARARPGSPVGAWRTSRVEYREGRVGGQSCFADFGRRSRRSNRSSMAWSSARAASGFGGGGRFESSRGRRRAIWRAEMFPKRQARSAAKSANQD